MTEVVQIAGLLDNNNPHCEPSFAGGVAERALFGAQAPLRGGPTKLNVSKTGATVSTRNALGSSHWIKPNRSSAKVGGVQVRGKNVAFQLMIYMLFVGLAMAVQVLM